MPDFVYSYDWYDGPRSGVADYEGKPYFFVSQWIDVYTQKEDWFKLSPISQEIFELELERWKLWTNYQAANQAGLVGNEYHPYLPSDRLRGEALTQMLEKQLVIDEANCLIAQAIFIPLDVQTMQAMQVEMIVKWELLDGIKP
jgi:hypothetical protein